MPHFATVFSHSGWPHAHFQRSRSHRHHRVRHPGPRSDAGQAAAQRGLLRHPQPPSARQDGCRVQSLRKHVWTHARHVPGNIRCACLCDYAVCVSFVIFLHMRFLEERTLRSLRKAMSLISSLEFEFELKQSPAAF